MEATESFYFSLEHLNDAAAWVCKQGQGYRLWCFQGDLGAGKTTLIREICRQLGVQGEVTSPTFSLVNEHYLPDGARLFHFDFYRIKDAEEVYDIGFETYFDSGALCLIEWPGKIRPILEQETYLLFSIETAADGRLIRAMAHAPGSLS